MKYQVIAAKIEYDLFEVEAESPREAASLVANGKSAEKEFNVGALCDTFNDDQNTIKVLSGKGDGCGYDKPLAIFDRDDL